MNTASEPTNELKRQHFHFFSSPSAAASSAQKATPSAPCAPCHAILFSSPPPPFCRRAPASRARGAVQFPPEVYYLQIIVLLLLLRDSFLEGDRKGLLSAFRPVSVVSRTTERFRLLLPKDRKSSFGRKTSFGQNWLFYHYVLAKNCAKIHSYFVQN